MFLHTCQKIEVTPLQEQAPFHLPATDRARHMQPEGRMATLRRAKAPQLLLPSMWGTLDLGTATEAMNLHGPL